MVDFSDPAIDEQLDGAVVRMSPLVIFDFKSQPVRLWPGFGNVRVPIRRKPLIFQGTGGLGALSVAGFGLSSIVEEMTFRLAATEDVLTAADADIADGETDGRSVEVWLQWFDARNDREWAVLGDPLLYFWGKMGTPELEKSPPDELGVVTQSVELTAQNVLIDHAKPPYSYFSDRDQRARSSDGEDNLCLRMQEFVDGSVLWPRFS